MGLTEPKNYLVPTEWTPLTDIMSDDYETTDDYIIHINSYREGNTFGYLYFDTSTPSIDDRGRELDKYSEIEVVKDTGDYVYLRGLVEPISIEIRTNNKEE